MTCWRYLKTKGGYKTALPHDQVWLPHSEVRLPHDQVLKPLSEVREQSLKAL